MSQAEKNGYRPFFSVVPLFCTLCNDTLKINCQKYLVAQRQNEMIDRKQKICRSRLGYDRGRLVTFFDLKERKFPMKKSTFVTLMIVETLMALVSMGLLFSDVGAAIYPISLAIFAVVLAPFYLWLKKTDEEAKKRKIRLWMVLVMLLPIVAAVVAVILVVTALMLLYS